MASQRTYSRLISIKSVFVVVALFAAYSAGYRISIDRVQRSLDNESAIRHRLAKSEGEVEFWKYASDNRHFAFPDGKFRKRQWNIFIQPSCYHSYVEQLDILGIGILRLSQSRPRFEAWFGLARDNPECLYWQKLPSDYSLADVAPHDIRLIPKHPEVETERMFRLLPNELASKLIESEAAYVKSRSIDFKDTAQIHIRILFDEAGQHCIEVIDLH